MLAALLCNLAAPTPEPEPPRRRSNGAKRPRLFQVAPIQATARVTGVVGQVDARLVITLGLSAQVGGVTGDAIAQLQAVDELPLVLAALLDD